MRPLSAAAHADPGDESRGHRRGAAGFSVCVAGAGDGVNSALQAAGVMWRSFPRVLHFTLQEIRHHLTFTLHADIATAHQIVVVLKQTVHFLGHLEDHQHVGKSDFPLFAYDG